MTCRTQSSGFLLAEGCRLAVPLCGESQMRPGSPLHTATLSGFHDHSLLLPVQAKDEDDSPLLLTLALLFVLNPAVNSLSFKSASPLILFILFECAVCSLQGP